jgi:deoxyribonuclease-4
MLVSKLLRASEYDATLVNLHIGSHRGSGLDVGIARLVDGIDAALTSAETQRRDASGPSRADQGTPVDTGPPQDPVRLVLENSAGGGGGMGTNVDELATIAHRLADRGIGAEQVGFCLDTAHAWGAGIDMSEPGAIDAFLASFDARIGVDRIALVHLNDTRSELGSRTDRHEHLGAGRIGAVGLGHVVRHPLLAHAPAIIETPGMDVGYDRINLARARALLHGKQLRPLPPEAFQLAGSARGRGATRRRAAAATTPTGTRTPNAGSNTKTDR